MMCKSNIYYTTLVMTKLLATHFNLQNFCPYKISTPNARVGIV